MDETKFHDDAIARLNANIGVSRTAWTRVYMDKLDGPIDAEFFDRKAAEFRSEQCRLMRDREAHQTADRFYIEEGIKLLELAQRAHRLFESQPAREKRKLLDCRLICWHLQSLKTGRLPLREVLQVPIFANWRGVVDEFGHSDVPGVFVSNCPGL